MEKKTILAFDFDGTLTSSFGVEDYSMAEACRQCGKPETTEQDIHDFYGPTESGIIRKIVGEENFGKAWSVFLDVYSKKSKELKPFPGLLKLLEKLSKKPKVLLILLTGRSRESLEISLKDLKLSGYFVKFYWGSEKGANKGASMQKILSDYGVERKDILYIGDALEDVSMMREEKIDIVSAGYSHSAEYQKKLEEVNPGLVAKDIQSLSKLLDKALQD